MAKIKGTVLSEFAVSVETAFFNIDWEDMLDSMVRLWENDHRYSEV